MIDIDKFVASVIKYYRAYYKDSTSIKCWLDDALEEQGLEYKNGEIVKTQRRIAAEAKEALFESDSERIRKEIIDYCHERLNTTYGALPNIETIKRWLAWLEKQSEQKPAESKPKFKVGDFIVNDYCFGKVVELTDDAYLLDTGQGIPFSCEHNAHLWTIQDAKDGDVLCYKDEVLLYKHDIKDWKETSFGGIVYYCCYDGKRFITDSFYSLTEQDKIDIHPATKEQRDILFQKMHEAGYEWDADKKELRKIEQKPTWSEEDDEIFGRIYYACVMFYDDEDTTLVNWLNAIKRKLKGE